MQANISSYFRHAISTSTKEKIKSEWGDDSEEEILENRGIRGIRSIENEKGEGENKKFNQMSTGKFKSSVKSGKRLPIPTKSSIPPKKITFDDLDLEKIDNDPIVLSSKQYEVIEAILNQQSVFFTGAAGTGKSFILHLLRELSVQLGIAAKVVFTAPTGLAACNIGGLTIHSWSGIGFGTSTTKQLVDQIMARHEVRNRWMNTDILVIDEISMLSAELFDTLSEIGKRVRNNYSEPFGGIQLVVCGDFFQLPPIHLGPKNRFCFKSNAWQELFPDSPSTSHPGKIIILDRVYRQRENQFLDILHEIRLGEVSTTTQRFLYEKVSNDQRRQRESEMREHAQLSARSSDDLLSVEENLELFDYDRPTKLFGTNKDVDLVNKSELGKLPTESYVFQCSDYAISKNFESQIKSGSRLPEELELKTGAEVLLLWNLDHSVGLVNGARGKVVGFERSRGRSKIFRDFLPVVEFRLRVGDQQISDTRVIWEQESEIKQANRVVASRTQLPLMLAYAITIHKAQGMTISKLEVSFKGVFEYGQGYVAISRATDLEGLYLTNFTPNLIKAHPDVKQYYAELFRSSSKSLTEDHETSLRELCRIRKCAVVEPKVLIKDQSDGWIVKKGANAGESDEENHTTAPSISPDDLDQVPHQFSAFAYDDFLEYELPKKQQPKRVSSSSRFEAVEESPPKKLKRETKSKVVSEERSVSPPASDWDFYEKSNTYKNEKSDPSHSHLRSVDPNKNWNMIVRTTGPMNANPVPRYASPVIDKRVAKPSPSSTSTSSPTSAPKELTDDQKRKMEENRRLAMARLEENRAKQRHQLVESYINQLT